MPKLEIPRFFTSAEHRTQFLSKLKLVECPCCGIQTCLIGNGRLYGYDPRQRGCARIERGQRIRCSNRNQKNGCGHSFSIHWTTSLPNRSIDSALLVAFLNHVRQSAACIHAAWQQGVCQFSLSTAYRIWAELEAAQTHLRQRLCQCTGPPPGTGTEPRLQLLDHLYQALPQPDPIKAFQAHFQSPWWPCFRKHPATAPIINM